VFPHNIEDIFVVAVELAHHQQKCVQQFALVHITRMTRQRSQTRVNPVGNRSQAGMLALVFLIDPPALSKKYCSHLVVLGTLQV
jgi:hypothetical protein